MSWIERHILLELTRRGALRAHDLAPLDVEQNLLTHYLQKLIIAGFVQKIRRGVYDLTLQGEKLVGTFSISTGKVVDTLKTCILLYGKTTDDKYLLFQWKRQPYLGKTSFLTSRMQFGQSIDAALHHALDRKLGMQVPARYMAQGAIMIKKDQQLISHMHVVVFEVALPEIAFPYASRNGIAVLQKATGDEVMQGIAHALEAIKTSSTYFDVTLSY